MTTRIVDWNDASREPCDEDSVVAHVAAGTVAEAWLLAVADTDDVASGELRRRHDLEADEWTAEEVAAVKERAKLYDPLFRDDYDDAYIETWLDLDRLGLRP